MRCPRLFLIYSMVTKREFANALLKWGGVHEEHAKYNQYSNHALSIILGMGRAEDRSQIYHLYPRCFAR